MAPRWRSWKKTVRTIRFPSDDDFYEYPVVRSYADMGLSEEYVECDDAEEESSDWLMLEM